MLLFVYTTTRKRFVIFTCRYFKLSWNTTTLNQSNCWNFPCSSIKKIPRTNPSCLSQSWNFLPPKERQTMWNLGCFPFSQNFQFNRLKCKWNAGFQRKFSRTDGQPLEPLHFFRCNRSERKHAVPFARRRDFSRHFQCPVSGRSLTYL